MSRISEDGPLHITPELGLTTHWQEGSTLRRKLELYGNLKPSESLPLLYDLQLDENADPHNMALVSAMKQGRNVFRTYVRNSRFSEAYSKLWDHFKKHGVVFIDTENKFNGRVHADMSAAALQGFLEDSNSGAISLSEENTLVFHYSLQKQERTGPVYVYEGPFHSTLATDPLPDSDIVMPNPQNGRCKIVSFGEYTAHRDTKKFDAQAKAYQEKVDRYTRYGSSAGMLFTPRPPVLFITPRLDDGSMVDALRKQCPWASFGSVYSVHQYGRFLDNVKKSLHQSSDMQENLQWLQSRYPMRTRTWTQPQ